MSKDFSELKRKLNELSETINKFESEAVQLRIVELLFKSEESAVHSLEEAGDAYEIDTAPVDMYRSLGRRKRRNGSVSPHAVSASGAVAVLSRLVDEGFFSEPRSISDVVRQGEQVSGILYKSNAFSGPLSRLAANGVLQREKNQDGQFVYQSQIISSVFVET